MSTTITAENGIEFEVCSLGISIVDHEEQWKGWARLSPEQRRALADALASERAETGGQWTRDDLPSIGTPNPAHDPVVEGALDTVVHWLNKHYPKPVAQMPKSVPAPESPRTAAMAVAMTRSALERMDRLTAERDELRRERDEALRVKGEMVDRAVRAERERDATVARAEQLIPAYAMLDIWMALGRDSIHFDDWYEDQGYADAWAELTAAVREGHGDLDAARETAEHYQAMFDATERQRDEWKARAEKAEKRGDDWEQRAHEWMKRAETSPVVSRAEIEKAVRRGHNMLNAEVGVVNEMCDLLGIEAEQDADPVEAKARELYEVGNPGTVGMWESIHEAFKDGYRRMALHVLGQEPSSDE